jgi:methyltransferase-like protein
MTQTDKITHIIINAQMLNNRLTDSIGEKVFKQNLKLKCNHFLTELIKVEKEWYDKFFDAKEQSTIDVYNVYEKFINEVSKVPIWEMENIITILKAYQKDPKSIEGITKKIMK